MGHEYLQKPRKTPSRPTSQTVLTDPAAISIGYKTDRELLSGNRAIGGLVASARAVKQELPSLQEEIWQPMVRALLQQAGQRLLAWLWSQLQERYSNELELARQAQDITHYLLHPQASLVDKCSRLITFLGSFPALSIYLGVIRKLEDIAGRFSEQDSCVTRKGFSVLHSLIDLLDEPLVKYLATEEELSSIRGWLGGALNWAESLQRLSQVSWDTPESLIKGLLHSSVLPAWANEQIAQGQALHENLIGRIEYLKSQLQSESAQRLQSYLEQFAQGVTPIEKLTALLHLMLDDDIVSLLATHAPMALGDTFKVLALLQNSMRAIQGSTSNVRSTLLGVEYFTSAAFIQNLESEGGTLGQQLGVQLGKVRTALRGSASQEAAMNLLLRLTDPKKSWSDFALESTQELMALPETQELAASLASHFTWQTKVARALYQVLDDTFWSRYQTSKWKDLPSLVGATLLRDLQSNHSHLASAATTATGLAPGLLQDVLRAVASVLKAWRGDSWSGFLEQADVAISNLLSQHGSILPAQVQQAVELGLWAARNIAKLMLLRTLWNARDGRDKFREVASDQLRELVRKNPDDTTLWALEKALIWLPLLASLFKVLGTMPAMEKGQQIKWLADLLIRLYGEPSVQQHPEVARLRQQVENIAQQWLNEIPKAMLSEAIFEEVKSRPGNGVKLLIKAIATAHRAGSYLLREAASAFELGLAGSSDFLSNPVGLPRRQRPAYLPRLRFDAVMPAEFSGLRSEEGGEPLSSYTPEIGWAAATGATIMGLVFTYRSYQSLKQRRGLQLSERSRQIQGTELQQVITEPLIPLAFTTGATDQASTSTPSTSERQSFLPNESQAEATPGEQTLWHPGIYATLAVISFGGAILSGWTAYNSREDNPIGPIPEALATHIERTSATLQSDLDALSKLDTENPSQLVSAFAKICKDLETLEAALAAIDMGEDEMVAAQTIPRLDIAPPAPLTQTPGRREALVLAGRKKRVAMRPHETKYNDFKSQLGNIEKQITLLNRNIETLTRQLREPFIVNNVKNARSCTVGPFGNPICDYETRTEYDTRRAGLWIQLSNFRSDIQAENKKTGSINQQIETLAPLLLQELFGSKGPLTHLEDTTQTVAFDTKFQRYSNDDYLRIADLVTQYNWQDLILENNGTPIGFTEMDVLVKAIHFVELQIVHNEGERDKLLPDDNWRKDYQAEIDKLFALLKVLHIKEGDSLRLKAQSSAGDALFGGKVKEFVDASWKEKAQRIAQHPQLKDLTMSSSITLKRIQGSDVLYFSMPLARVLGGEHERIATNGVRVEVEWPNGLLPTDLLLQELMDECAVFREMQKRGLEVQSAMARIKMPIVKQELQSGLERVVREIAPAGKKHMPIQLGDTVQAKFTPMEVYDPELAILKKYIPVVNKSFTLMQVMAKAPEREFIKMTSYTNLEVDTAKKFPVEVIQVLRDIDWQRKIENTVQELRRNKQLHNDWKLVFGSQIADKMTVAGEDKAVRLTLNGCRLPGVYMLEKSGGIELHSLFNKTRWTFVSLDKAVEALSKTVAATTATQQDHKLYTWLDEHRDAYERGDNRGKNMLSLVGDREDAGRAAESALGDLLNQMESDADTLLKSNAELNTHRVFQFFTNISPLVGLATMPISGPTAFLMSVGLAALPFTELAVADTKAEFKEIAVQAAINAAFEVGPVVVLTTLSKVPVKQIARGIAQKLRKGGDDIFKGLKKTEPPVPTVRLEPLRQLPSGKVGNLAPGMNEYLDLLKKDTTIAKAIASPAGECAGLLTSVAKRIQQADIGMTNIKYRGMHIWSNATERTPTNHFVVIGEKGRQKYVFDLSARQFENHMPDLNGPLILTEHDWAQKYANASSRKLIKYQDFNDSRVAETRFNALPGHSPKDVIDGGTLLTAPQWYKTLTQWNPTGVARANDVVYAGLGRSNPVRDAARSNMLSGGGQGVCWDYAADVLRDADILTQTQAKKLTDGLKKAANYQGMGDSGRIDNLVADPRSVKNSDELLRVKQGELVVFMEIDPNMPGKGARPVNVLVSLGNGRFAGMKNDLLDSQLGASKSILTAEELGGFTPNDFYRFGGATNSPSLEIKVGYPMGAKAPHASSIAEAAGTLAREGGGASKSWEFVADVLEGSGELAREQADAFKELAALLCEPSKSGQVTKLSKLLVNPQPLASAEALKAIPRGHIVAISDSEFSAKQLMLSLGDGTFATAKLDALDVALSGTKGIVTAETLGEKLVNGKLGGFSLKTGPVNVEGMRVRSLLGKDASFALDNNKVLSVQMHGAPSIVNYMDASELSHAIRGLIKVHGNGVNVSDIRRIELNSCFGAMGSPSTGQVLADILGKDVKAYPLKYSGGIASNPEWWRPKPTIFKPRPQVANNAEALDKGAKQNMRNHDFWGKLLGLYKQSRDAVTSIRTKRETTDAFEGLLKDVSELVMQRRGANVNSFMQAHPKYLNNGDDDSRAAVNAELKNIIGDVKPDDLESFSQRCMEVLSLTEDAFKMLNVYLSMET